MSEEVVEEGTAEKLMGALITKMESMDNSLSILKAENSALKQIVADPAMLLKRAGFIRSGSNSAPMDVMPDLFRGDATYDILKDESVSGIPIPENNQEFHEMDWADIHRLAEEAKGTGNIGNNIGME